MSLHLHPIALPLSCGWVYIGLYRVRGAVESSDVVHGGRGRRDLVQRKTLRFTSGVGRGGLRICREGTGMPLRRGRRGACRLAHVARTGGRIQH